MAVTHAHDAFKYKSSSRDRFYYLLTDCQNQAEKSMKLSVYNFFNMENPRVAMSKNLHQQSISIQNTVSFNRVIG